MIKQVISTVITMSILTTQVFANAITGLPSVNNSDANISCAFRSQEDFYPVGDTLGKSIYTKQDVVRDCNVTREVQGACLKWREDKVIASVPTEAYSSYDTKDYSDTIGSFFATVGAYDQMEHLWSGFSGYCASGTLRDFDWASDPMFWGSLAMGYLMAGGEAGPVSDSANGAMNSVGEAVITDSAKNKAAEIAMNSMSDSALDMTLNQAAQVGIDKAINTLGKCLVSASYNMAAATANFLTAGSGSEQEDCNPIDEICGDDNPDNGGTSDIQTMDVQTFIDLSDSLSEQGDNIYDFINVIDDGSTTGVVSFQYIPKSDMGVENMDMSAANDLMKKVRNIQMAISMGVAAGGLAACMYFDGAVGTSTTTQNTVQDPNRKMLQTGLNAGIDLAAKFAGPYGPAIAVAAKLVVALAMSYQSIDSCNSSKDAKKMGSRHEKTQKSLKFDLCRPMWDTCEDEFFWGSCALQGYHYCCYDQLLTKVLVTQIKAELGREWTDCTGVSIRDLNYVSFDQCTAAEMADGIDGAHAYGMSVNPRISNGATLGDYEGPVWNPEDAFQYKHKCMDLTEFKDFLQAQIGEDIDPDTFHDFWNGLTKKQPI